MPIHRPAAIATSAMAVTAWGIEYVLTASSPGQHFLMQGVRLLTAIGGGLVVLVVAARLLHIDELKDALGVLGVRFTL